MQKIVQVRKNSDGNITHVKLDDGQQTTINQAINMAKRNQIQNVIVGKARDGSDTLRSRNNSIQSDNLSNLPTF